MDRERLGRVLGRGARMAARTAMEAVDAASSPAPAKRAPTGPAPVNPAAAQPTAAAFASTQTATPQVEIVPPARSSTAQNPSQPRANVAQATAAAKGAVAGPLRRASRALWHELTGSFFALFTLSFLLAAWKTHNNAFSPIASERYRLYTFCLLTLLFAYFSASSFLRARRR